MWGSFFPLCIMKSDSSTNGSAMVTPVTLKQGSITLFKWMRKWGKIQYSYLFRSVCASVWASLRMVIWCTAQALTVSVTPYILLKKAFHLSQAWIVSFDGSASQLVSRVIHYSALHIHNPSFHSNLITKHLASKYMDNWSNVLHRWNLKRFRLVKTQI